MDLYANRALPRPLRLKASDERLDIFAAAAEDKSAVVLFAINPKPEWALVSVALTGFAKIMHPWKAEAVCDTRTAGQPDVMNHWEAPERVRLETLPITSETVTLPPLSVAAIQYR